MSSVKQVQFVESGRVPIVAQSSSGTVSMTETSTEAVVSIPSKPSSGCKGKNCYCKNGRGRGLWRISWIL